MAAIDSSSMTGQPLAGSPAPQAELDRLRRDVLAGRGPGASGSEFLANTRWRADIGGRPVPWLREQVALDADAARRNPEGLALRSAVARGHLQDDVGLLLPRVRPPRVADGAWARVATASVRRRVRPVLLLVAAARLLRGRAGRR